MKTFKQFLQEEPSHLEHAKKIPDAPDWSPELAEGDYQVGGKVTFSAKHGLGAVPFNQSVYYHGLVVTCRPSTFLKLALPHEGQREKTANELVDLVKEGYALGIPWFDISFRDTHKDPEDPPKITGHEGRGRMIAIKKIMGDALIPIHLILGGGDRARHLTPELIKILKAGVRSERVGRLIEHPFGAVYVDGKKV